MYSKFSWIRTLYEGRVEGVGRKYMHVCQDFSTCLYEKTTTGILLHIGGVACAPSELNTGIVRLRNGAAFHFPTRASYPRFLTVFCDWPLPLSLLSELLIGRNARTSTVASRNENQASSDCPDRRFCSKYLALSAALMTFSTSKDAFQEGNLRSSRLIEIPQRFS